jgi:hypothetical protein
MIYDLRPFLIQLLLEIMREMAEFDKAIFFFLTAFLMRKKQIMTP